MAGDYYLIRVWDGQLRKNGFIFYGGNKLFNTPQAALKAAFPAGLPNRIDWTVLPVPSKNMGKKALENVKKKEANWHVLQEWQTQVTEQMVQRLEAHAGELHRFLPNVMQNNESSLPPGVKLTEKEKKVDYRRSKFKGELEIDHARGVIYFHLTDPKDIQKLKAQAVLRICSLPRPIPKFENVAAGIYDITFGYGCSWQSDEEH